MLETCMRNENLAKMAENVMESPKFGYLYKKSGLPSSNLTSDLPGKVVVRRNGACSVKILPKRPETFSYW